MKKTTRVPGLTYAQLGIDRNFRQKSQNGIQSILQAETRRYKSGKPIRLPFGNIFPTSKSGEDFFDFQIEGVGTKTLLAEVAGKYDTIGIDGVAMAVNDILRSGADPLLLSDGIHIRKSEQKVLDSLISGVQKGAEISNSVLASGETGDVCEILHDPLLEDNLPFDLFVSCLGLVQKDSIVRGRLSLGDQVIGLESSGIHSNGLTLARKTLLKKWGGLYDPYDIPEVLDRPLIEELLEPTRIYSRAIAGLRKDGIEIKAAIHVTGDGLGKFSRLLDYKTNSRVGLRLKLSRKPAIFQLIIDSAKKLGTPVSTIEMFRTFNMGIGFGICVSKANLSGAIDSLNKECVGENIGFVTGDGKISVESPFTGKPISL